MKKILFILFATLLFCGEAWAASVVPPSQLKAGHYYRIRGRSGNYMCWAGQESPGTSSDHATMMKQPVIFINAEKARTEPGTIWLLTGSGPNNWKLTAQNVEMRSTLNGKTIGFEMVRSQSVLWWDIEVAGLKLNTNSVFNFEEPNPNPNNIVYIKTNGNGASGMAALGDRDCYFQPTGNNNKDGYLGVTSATGTSAEFYFEEVDGSDNAFLGFPPVDRSYSISGNLLNTSGQVYTSYSGSGTYQISDVTSGQDQGGTLWYYATMCLPFPVEVPGNVRCFFVDNQKKIVPIEYNQNNLNGTGHFAKPVDVIPAGTAFVARSQSNNPNDNRFVPYIAQSTVYAPVNNSVNQLKKANSYLVKNAQNSTSENNTINLFKLSSTSAGEVEFLTKITSNSEKTDGNRAFFGQQSEPIVFEPEDAELADLIYENNGSKWTKDDYVKITDDLLVCYVNEKAGLVFARDNENNKGYWSKVTTTPSNYYNFAPEETPGGDQQLLTPADYNQSNWVIIKVPTSMASQFLPGMTIPGGNLKGTIETDKTRPIFNMEAVANQSGSAVVNLNTYSIAHLMAGSDNLLKSNYDNEDYFFMTPKPVEVANITWAVLKQYDNAVYAYIPAKYNSNGDRTGDNGLDFRGRVLLSPEFYAGNANDWTEEQLQEFEGKAICFKAAITPESGSTSASAPRRSETPSINADDPISTNHVIYPLDISPTNVIVTSVEGVKSTATVKSVKFYNLQGIESDVPFDGVNIVVEQLNDGTTRSSKMLF